MTKNRTTARLQWYDLMFILLIGFSGVVLVWKAGYGFGLTRDEPFYLTIAHRLLLGDALLADEWNLSQLSAILTMPFVAVYRLVCGGTDGIIRGMRWFYILVHTASTTIFYLHTRRTYKQYAVGACAIWLLYLPYLYESMTYNTWAMELLLLGGIFLSDAGKQHSLRLVVGGICFALSVLCCPFLIVGWVILLAFTLLRHTLAKKARCLQFELLEWRGFLLFTLGCVLTAVGFLAFVFSRTDLNGILNAIPNILSDTAHEASSVTTKLAEFVRLVLMDYPYHFNWIYLWIVYFLLCASAWADQKRFSHREAYLTASLLMALASLFMFEPALETNFQRLIIPLLMPGGMALLLTEKKPYGLILCVFGTGLLYSVCQHFASNNAIFAIAMAASVAVMACCLFWGQVMEEIPSGTMKNLVGGLMAACVLFVFVLHASAVINYSFYDVSPFQADAMLEGGPFDGIRTSGQNAADYSLQMEDLEWLKQQKPESVLLLTKDSWPYLALNDVRYATFSAWINEGEERRLSDYFDLHPDRTPQVILMPYTSYLNTDETCDEIKDAGYSMQNGAYWRIFSR